jgi:Ca-activated chloride channel family protein
LSAPQGRARRRYGVHRARRALGVLLALVLAVLAACSGSDDDGVSRGGDGLDDPGDCTPIDMAVSSEKVTLLTELARSFNDSDLADLGDGECAFVRVQTKASGAGMQLLADGWPNAEVNGPQPVVWSPAASSWGAILNQRLSETGQPAMASDAEPIMLTPLVIAMPEPMADALGYPEEPIGYADILALARDPEGWGRYGHLEWGPFRLGKTNPNFSTSALHATIAQYYAATGKTEGLSLEDLERANVTQFARGVESAVVHYGDITMTFLNNWFRNDARGTSLTYVSSVAFE